MVDRVDDRTHGISIRFIRSFDIEHDRMPPRVDVFVTAVDAALFLASRDDRDLPYVQKLRDACTYILEHPGAVTIDARKGDNAD